MLNHFDVIMVVWVSDVATIFNRWFTYVCSEYNLLRLYSCKPWEWHVQIADNYSKYPLGKGGNKKNGTGIGIM